MWLKWNLNLYVKILYWSLPTIELRIACVKERKETYFYIISKKTKGVEENLLLIFQSLSFKTDLNKNLICLSFFYTNGSVGAKPPKKCANIIADYKPCHQYEDFGTWVGNQSEMVVWPCGDNREAFLGLLQISLIVKMNLSRNLNLFGCHKKNFTAL